MSLIRTAAVLTALMIVGAGSAMAQAAARPTPTRMPHRAAAREDCLSCHAAGAREHVAGVPADHRYQNAMCARCHRPAETLPAQSQHAFDAPHTRCTTCHVAGNTTGAKPPPASHTGRHPTTCALCHEPQAGS